MGSFGDLELYNWLMIGGTRCLVYGNASCWHLAAHPTAFAPRDGVVDWRRQPQ